MAAPNATKTQLLNGAFDLATDTIRIALISSSTAYTFDPDTHEFVSDILDGGTTAEEFSGSSGYTGSGDRQTLANPTTSQDNTDDEGVFDADDVTWTGVDGTNDIQGFLIYKQVGADDTTPGDDRVLAVYDDDSATSPTELPLSVNGSDVTVSWNAEGIINTT